MEPLELFANIRQGMKVIDNNGDVIGQVRDLSQRSVLIMEAGGTRVFWIDGGEIASIDGQSVRLKRQNVAVPSAASTPSPA